MVILFKGSTTNIDDNNSLVSGDKWEGSVNIPPINNKIIHCYLILKLILNII